MKIILFLTLIAFASAGFWYTEKLYNGTASFSDIYGACAGQAFSATCSDFLLAYGQFWLDPIFARPAWILDVRYNCGGDAAWAVGSCITANQSTTCTCDMNLPVCCFTQ